MAVIGTGCSAIQTVPQIQPLVEHVEYHTRRLNVPEIYFTYSARAQRLFERFPALQRLDRIAVFVFMEAGAAAMTSRRWLLAPFRAVGRRQIEMAISDRELRAKVTPQDEIGCKR